MRRFLSVALTGSLLLTAVAALPSLDGNYFSRNMVRNKHPELFSTIVQLPWHSGLSSQHRVTMNADLGSLAGGQRGWRVTTRRWWGPALYGLPPTRLLRAPILRGLTPPASIY